MSEMTQQQTEMTVTVPIGLADRKSVGVKAIEAIRTQLFTALVMLNSPACHAYRLNELIRDQAVTVLAVETLLMMADINRRLNEDEMSLLRTDVIDWIIASQVKDGSFIEDVPHCSQDFIVRIGTLAPFKGTALLFDEIVLEIEEKHQRRLAQIEEVQAAEERRKAAALRKEARQAKLLTKVANVS